MNCLNNNILDVIFKYKHQLEYIHVMQEIHLYKHKIMFSEVLFQMSENLRRNCLHYSIYNPRFEKYINITKNVYARFVTQKLFIRIINAIKKRKNASAIIYGIQCLTLNLKMVLFVIVKTLFLLYCIF